VKGLRPEDLAVEVRLPAVDLAPVGVAFHVDVDEVQQLLPAAAEPVGHDDEPRAGPEHGPPRGRECADGLDQPVVGHELAHRRALAARDDQAVDLVEPRGQADLDGLGAERPQHPDVFAESPLQGEHADFHGALPFARGPPGGAGAPGPVFPALLSNGVCPWRRGEQRVRACGMGLDDSYFAFPQGMPSAVIFF